MGIRSPIAGAGDRVRATTNYRDEFVTTRVMKLYGPGARRRGWFLGLKFIKALFRIMLTDAGSMTTCREDTDAELVATINVAAYAPSLNAACCELVGRNSPGLLFRTLAAHHAERIGLAHQARTRCAPVAALLAPFRLKVGGRSVHSRIFSCHDPATGTTYDLQVATLEGRGGPAWIC